ncbi:MULTISPECIES: 4Fe-4S dicluster domain-containing protein [Emticicia]|uniref:4Fe-4S binding protein n=1 Tax=Emticicia TaxID=312278 RepID=UPI0007D8B35D|nr:MULTISPECIES: 4Fe-4S dicluster domain-containing protein [Emticicia]
MLQKLGLFIFIAGFGLFIGTLGMNNYTLTNEILEKNFKEDALLDAKIELASMIDQSYSNSYTFTAELSEGINQLNKVYNGQQAWDKKIYEDTILSIVKSSANGYLVDNKGIMFLLTFGLAILGALLFILPEAQKPAGIKNNGIYFNPAMTRKWLGIGIGTFLIVFYIALYFKPQYIANWTMLVDPVSKLINGGEASRWFMYGFLYTISVLVMGIRYIIKYRHSKYQIFRTLSIMFFQTCIAFILPEIMSNLNLPSADLKNMWPLDYSFFFNYRIDKLIAGGTFGIFLLVWGIALFVVGVPVMVYFFGKRWYCSWVCGCGGLAETLGDPFRQLSDKSLKAWKIERYLIHGVLAFAIIMTIGVLYTYFTGSYNLLGFIPTESLKSSYGFLIGSIFSGVVGTGFYPLMGNRVWCRFGCPLAAYLGIIQRFKSKFRITTNGGQCISCGNCSTHCEMGIDVRAYAQKGQDIVRSSCVGCGVCSAVCPRGVLNLENAETGTRVMIAPEVLLGNLMEK